MTRATHAIVNSWAGTDQATGKPASIAVAFGFARADSGHQVGADAYDPSPAGGGPPDAYDQANAEPHLLGGSDSADGQTDGAVEQRLRFNREGRAEARLIIAGGSDGAAALSALGAGRRPSFRRQIGSVGRYWRGALGDTRLPAGGGRRVVNVAKRSLISVLLARVAETGAIVASANTQGPYGEDWIRDGAFINHLLDLNGFHDFVTEHNLFYARVQASTENPSPLRPSGNWAMNSYFDGVDGGPIPWEIDETGLGIWTLYDHSLFLHGDAAKHYLGQVYPAIERAANFLTLCEDPTNGLQCDANEDDNYTPSQSLHGAEAVYLGLRSAIAAAGALGDDSAQVTSWQQRLDRLRAAIDNLYDPARGAYGSGNSTGNAYNLDYSDGGWLLWPVQFRRYDDPRMAAESEAVSAGMHSSFSSDQGQYEAKALLALGYAWKPLTTAHRKELSDTLAYMAKNLTTPTGLFGESWRRLPDGSTIPVQDMPHVWEHTLWYLAALKIEGDRRYRFARRDLYMRSCRHHIAPRSACTR